MKTFFVHTLGCKVNHYESDQVAALLRARGLIETTDLASADLRVVNTCSVTTEAASKSRQTTRRLVRLPLLQPAPASRPASRDAPRQAAEVQYNPITHAAATRSEEPGGGTPAPADQTSHRPRVVVIGCWATSDPTAAASLAGVDAVLTHRTDVAAELDRLLCRWRTERPLNVAPSLRRIGDSQNEGGRGQPAPAGHGGPARAGMPFHLPAVESPPEPIGNEGWIKKAGSPAGARTPPSRAGSIGKVNAELRFRAAPIGAESVSVEARSDCAESPSTPSQTPARGPGTTTLPLLGERQSGRQRAFLKVQDGCDAHCTYCIIPKLRPTPWTKPVADAVEEARRLVAAGHVEIVLTGIFLGAYGYPTALRRRQPAGAGRPGPLGELVHALCTDVPGLRRVRLSSLEPGDLTDELLALLRDHPQVVPHFHLPLQSGSDAILHRMNRQYGRDDFLRMVERVNAAYDRPALTTDVIVGFPGETEEEFERTAEVVDAARFIHVHAFPFSPRPGTAAARWAGQFVRGPVVHERIRFLQRRAAEHSLAFRRQFLGEVVELLVEQQHDGTAPVRHGRCERYFDVHFAAPATRAGAFVRVRITDVSADRTTGVLA